MSDLRDINPNKYNNKGQTIILRKIMPPDRVRLNQYLVLAILTLMMIIILMGFFLIPGNSRLLQTHTAENKAVAVYNVPMNPAVSVEINRLKGQLVGLLSGSIESKVRRLENSIRTGVISSTDMGTIQELKNDLKVLKTYSETGAGRLIAQPELESSSGDKLTDNVIATEKLLNEISQLKGLVYLSIVSCGLMLAALGGVWLQSRYRLGHSGETEKLLRKVLDKDDG